MMTGGDDTAAAEHHGDSYLDRFLRLGEAWDRFWFTPIRPHTLCVLRLLTGAMLLYCQLVLASDLSAFVGPHAWINNEMAANLHNGFFGETDWGRSYLWHFESETLIAAHHGFTLLISALFLVGFATRLTAPLALFLQLMYLHRLTGALFGAGSDRHLRNDVPCADTLWQSFFDRCLAGAAIRFPSTRFPPLAFSFAGRLPECCRQHQHSAVAATRVRDLFVWWALQGSR